MTQKTSKTTKTTKSTKTAKTTKKAAKNPPAGGRPKTVSLKKAVAALETLLRELDTLPAARAGGDPSSRPVEGLRLQLEGMVLTMNGACQGRDGQDDFSFPGI